MAALMSMTGFARESGTLPDGTAFLWEIKSVNGRGLDIRFRLPGGQEGLEAPFRDMAAKRLKRGNLQVALIMKREQRPEARLDEPTLERMLALALNVAARIPGGTPPRAEALLALPGVLRSETPEPDEGAEAAQRAMLEQGFARALDGLLASRGAEGGRLAVILNALLEEIAALTAEAVREAQGQPQAQRARLMENIAQLLDTEARARIPEERLAQEVALLASRSDVREELDRLDSHIAAARALLAEADAVGRKLEFLTQEFVREANTLCSKSATVGLTRVGLSLKAAIERLKEQSANVE
ncbi:YicC/YloC family endoribonuclease [Rhodovarius lipocyclicus]|uniref:YicC/YloC family endoribonuclease n=1 Tax=Rhodovarius lipocyclicus TaxID=268410 RepID=UPI001F1B9CC5|nr:YicC/YloC family endoribonuclease [Rhodovarius lipocyclicus]